MKFLAINFLNVFLNMKCLLSNTENCVIIPLSEKYVFQNRSLIRKITIINEANIHR